MKMITTLLAAAALASAFGSGASAQNRPDHQGMNRGGTMHRDGCEPGMGMMCMMGGRSQMMMGGRAWMGMGGPATEQRVTQRLDAVKARLKITKAQEPQWNAYAAAVRDGAKAMIARHQAFMGKMPSAALPERLAMHEAMLAAQLDNLRKAKTAATALFAVLTDEQKKTADAALMGPMGRGMGRTQ